MTNTNLRSDTEKTAFETNVIPEVNEKDNYDFNDKKYRDTISDSYMKCNDSELKNTATDETACNPTETTEDPTNKKTDEE